MISIIIPSFNSEHTLQRCLDAIRQSDYTDYEIIIADDCSTDGTVELAKKNGVAVVSADRNGGAGYARTLGYEAAKGDTIVFVDSDILIQPDTLTRVLGYFEKHPDWDAVTGRLSLEHPNKDFFSLYKNAYMHYIFGELPRDVEFVYGSLFAIRRDRFLPFHKEERLAEDAAWGHRITKRGRKIMFLKELEVIHLKKHTFASWTRNDFIIPYAMARPFLLYEGWKQFFRKGIGFSHVPKHVLISIGLLFSLFFGIIAGVSGLTTLFLLGAVWVIINFNFFRYLSRHYGLKFGLLSVPATLYDHVVMGFGVLCGFAHAVWDIVKRKYADYKRKNR